MRILYQLTSPMDRTLGTAEIERRKGVLQAAAASGTEVECWPVGDGPASIEGPADAAIVVPEMLRLVPRWKAAGLDAIVIGCFSDPGLDALRERTAIPVVGPGAAALHLAAQLGTTISILSPSGRSRGKVATRLRALGLADLFASVRGVGASVMDLASQKPGAFERIVTAGRACRDDDGADVLVLGCMSMAFLPGVAQRLQAAVGCPVVNPVLASLKTAEAVVTLGTGHRISGAAPMPEAAE